METTIHTQEKQKPSYLWWENIQTDVRTLAGVAFYNAQFGEFKLKIDALEFLTPNETGLLERAQLFCKAIGSQNNKVEYRIEKVVKRQGKKFWQRLKVGEGVQNPDDGGAITLSIPPFDMGYRLVLIPAQEQEEATAKIAA